MTRLFLYRAVIPNQFWQIVIRNVHPMAIDVIIYIRVTPEGYPVMDRPHSSSF